MDALGLRRKLNEEHGQMLVLGALSLVAFIAILGFAIDVGHLRYEKRSLQNAADAAAIAAALEIRICGGVEACPAMQSAAVNALAQNGYPNATVVANCSGSANKTGVTLMLDNPACEDSADPNRGNPAYAEAIVTDQVPMWFAQMLDIRSETVSARAEAGRIGGLCIVALGGPPGGPYTDAGALNMAAGVVVDSRCPLIDESTSSEALECGLSIGVNAPQINVSGGMYGLLGILPSLCGLWTTQAHLNVPALQPHDPLAYLPAPSNANAPCGSGSGNVFNGSQTQVSILLGGNYTFNPGVYCGGIAMTASVLANITFNPGVYILRQTQSGLLGTGLLANGGLDITLSALSSITGQGVTFYNEGGTSNITIPATLGLSNFNLSAPISGEYGGILFYQPASNTSADTFLVSLAQGGVMNGVVYAPNAQVLYGVSALSSSYNCVVARDVTLLAGVISAFGNNYSSLQSGTPMNGNVALVVQ